MELELLMVVSYHVYAGNQTSSLYFFAKDQKNPGLPSLLGEQPKLITVALTLSSPKDLFLTVM